MGQFRKPFRKGRATPEQMQPSTWPPPLSPPTLTKSLGVVREDPPLGPTSARLSHASASSPRTSENLHPTTTDQNHKSDQYFQQKSASAVLAQLGERATEVT